MYHSWRAGLRRFVAPSGFGIAGIPTGRDKPIGVVAKRDEFCRRHVIQTAAGTFVIVFVAPGGGDCPRPSRLRQRVGVAHIIPMGKHRGLPIH